MGDATGACIEHCAWSHKFHNIAFLWSSCPAECATNATIQQALFLYLDDRNVLAVASLSPDGFDAVLCSSGSLPLPADLFSGLEQLTVEPSIASQSATFPTPAVPTLPLPSSATSAASGGLVLSGPSIVAKSQSQPSTTTTHMISAALQDGHSLPPGQVLAPALLAAAAPEGRRKKKTTRRVGYARDQPGEAATERAASDTASLPSGSASTLDTALNAADSHFAQSQPKPSVALAPTPLVAVAADTNPVASTTAAAVVTNAPTRLDKDKAPVSQSQALPIQPAQPKSPVKAPQHKEAPATVTPKRHHHKAAASTAAAPAASSAAAAAPAAVPQLSSLSLTDAVAAANLAAPLQTVAPAGLASLGMMPVALTSEALLQVFPYAWPASVLLGLVMTSVHACIVSTLLRMLMVHACHACVCADLAGSSALPDHPIAVQHIILHCSSLEMALLT